MKGLDEWGVKVYHKLLKSIGIAVKEAPVLCKGLDNTQPVFFDIGKSELGAIICIHKDIYAFCERMGKGQQEVALAFLLGHELVHYRDHKEDFHHCLNANNNNELEDQADMLGAFWTYYSGYQSIFDQQKIIDGLLDSLYGDPQFQLHPSSFHSPINRRRKAIQRAINESNYLAKVYEIGNYFLAIQAYDHAIACFDFLRTFLKLEEIYTNLGVAQLLLAESEAEVPCSYPVNLANNPLYMTRGGEVKRDSLLKEAIKNLEWSFQQNPNSEYYSKLLNLTSAYLASSNFDKASKLITKVKQSKDVDISTKGFILEGIFKKKKGNLLEANELFNKVISNTENLFIKQLARKNIEKERSPFPMYKVEEHRFGKIDLKSALINEDFEPFGSTKRGLLKTKTIFKQSEDALFWKQVIEEKSAFNTILVCIFKNSNQKTDKGIQLGSSQSELIDVYGIPECILITARGTYMSYLSRKLVFLIENKQVVEWGSFTGVSIDKGF